MDRRDDMLGLPPVLRQGAAGLTGGANGACRIALLVIASLPPAASADALRAPPCDELAQWAATIDPQARWEPFAENQRVWLPEAMAQPQFEALFAKPALQWTQSDVAAARTSWSGCIQQAKKARNQEQRALLQDTRRYLTSNLREVARYQERRPVTVAHDRERDARARPVPAERQDSRAAPMAPPPVSAPEAAAVSAAGLKAGVDELIATPPSVEALIALGSLSRLDTGDADALRQLEREFGYMRAPAGKAAHRIIRELRFRGTTGFETEQVPRIDGRLAQVKPVVLEQLKAEFSQNPADLHARRALAQRYERLMEQLQRALPQQEYVALAEETRNARRRVVDRAVADAQAQIDQVPASADGIARIDRIVSETAKRGLDIRQRRELVDHARSRQRVLADQILNAAAAEELPALPATLAGIQALNAVSNRMLQGIVQKASQDAIQHFVAVSEARLAEIGRQALPEYRALLSQVPETEAGLAQAEQELAVKQAWVDMEQRTRGEYVAAAQARRDQIAAVVEQARRQRRASEARARQRAIAAGGDPRLVGSEWVDENQTMQLDFRDQNSVFVTALGFKFAGTYEVSRDDVVVQGPHGQLVFTFNGDKLAGNGAVFRKREN
jgi:hypothetical protein